MGRVLAISNLRAKSQLLGKKSGRDHEQQQPRREPRLHRGDSYGSFPTLEHPSESPGATSARQCQVAPAGNPTGEEQVRLRGGNPGSLRQDVLRRSDQEYQQVLRRRVVGSVLF